MGMLTKMPGPTPDVATPNVDDQAVKAARLAERRRQLGFQGRMSTFLTDYQGQRGTGEAPVQNKSLMGS